MGGFGTPGVRARRQLERRGHMEKAYLDGCGQRLEVRKDRGVHFVVPCAALRFDCLGKSRDGIDVLGFPSANSG